MRFWGDSPILEIYMSSKKFLLNFVFCAIALTTAFPAEPAQSIIAGIGHGG